MNDNIPKSCYIIQCSVALPGVFLQSACPCTMAVRSRMLRAHLGVCRQASVRCHSVTVTLPKVLQRCVPVTLSLNPRLWVTQGLELQALSRLHGKEGRNRVGGGGGEIEHKSYLRVPPAPA